MKKPLPPTRWLSFTILVLLFFSPSLLQGCDAMIGSDPEVDELAAIETTAPESGDVFRHAHLLDRARTSDGTAGKSAGDATLNLVLGLATYEADGITPRIVNKFDVTRRILTKFGDGVTIKSELTAALDALTLTLSESQLDSLIAMIETDPDLSWLEPDALLEAILPDGAESNAKRSQLVPWNVSLVAPSKAPALLDPSRLRVYVLDTGVNPIKDVNVVESIDFTPYLDLRTPSPGEAAEEDTMNPRRDRPDTLGHGTHIAGVIAARDNEGGVLGIAPDAPIHSLKVMNRNGVTDMTVLLKAVDHIMQEKLAHPDLNIVVNMSLGADIETSSYNALDMAIRESIGMGIIYVVAAGNDGKDAATYSPAHVTEAITVGAYGDDDAFATFSNYGDVVDLLAPGVDVVSLSSYGSNTLMMSSGTSMAAPHVTGMVVRYLSLHPNSTPTEVASYLRSTARYGISGVPADTFDGSVFEAR